MLRKMTRNVRKKLAYILTISTIVSGGGYNSLAFGDVEYSDYLDGWKVQSAWSTLSTDYEWHAETASTRQPKIVTTYRLENAAKDYPVGSLTFSIPGIGAANRASIIKAGQLAADADDTEWNYTWDQLSDTYTFTNKFEVEEGQSVSGGFEMLWNLSARSCIDEFSQEKSPAFSVAGEGSILLEPLSYEFTSERDLNRLRLSASTLGAAAWEASDKDYVWYTISSGFDTDWKARGLYKSSYYVTVELPEGADYSDVVIKSGNSTLSLSQDETGAWGFYPFKNRYGDLTSNSFQLGLLKETLKGEEILVHGHLDRLFNDESEWLTEEDWDPDDGDHENVDDAITFTVDDYGFSYSGVIYSHTKTSSSYGSSSPYQSRMEAVNIYNGKVVQFYLSGTARRNYTSSGARTFSLRSAAAAAGASPSEAQAASPSEAEMELPEGISDWNDIHWKENGRGEADGFSSLTYGEVHGEMATGSEASPASLDDVEEEDGWPVFELINDLIASGKEAAERFHPFLMTAYAAEATPPEADAEDSAEGTAGENGSIENSNEGEAADTGASGRAGGGISSYSLDTPTLEGGNTTGISQVGEYGEYAMVLGDDKLGIFQRNGAFRELDDSEYDIAYVTVPSDRYSYDYEVWGATEQETHFDQYTPLGTGNTGARQTIYIPEGIKAVFVRVNGVTGSYTSGAYIGVRLHLDWETEMEKEDGLRPDHENRIVNFSYLRALYETEKDGVLYEANDCALGSGNYAGTYGEKLAERDSELYKEYLMRDYSHIWLREPVTQISSAASLAAFDGTPKTGFTSRVTAAGTIQADNDGSLTSFSLYSEIPEATQALLDETGISVTGSATDQNGNEVTEFENHVSLSTKEVDGKTYVVADFDFSDSPLQIGDPIRVSLGYDISLSYADFAVFGSRYTTRSYLMLHDDGIEKLVGGILTADSYDLDGDGTTGEIMATGSDYETVEDSAMEWREYASKYVKSYYSGGYVTDTVAKLYQENGTAEEKEQALYSYRLDFGLGSSNAKEIVFYDRIEQGASVAVNEDTPDEYTHIPSAWQGTFQSVDTSYAEKKGLVPTVYYSSDAEQEFDLEADGWSETAPEDLSEVKSIAVRLDTSALEDGVLKTNQMVYLTVNMRTPADDSFVGTKAVNQYTVTYEGYGLTGIFEKKYELPSAETYVKLLDTVGTLSLQKVDADHVIREDSDGTKTYATLTGGAFQVYDADRNPLFEEPKALSAIGRIQLKNMPYGTYYWEEVTAPQGYQKVDGLHEFLLDGSVDVLSMENHRIPGEVTLTKEDADDSGYGPLSGAVFELYQADGTQVATGEKTDGVYSYEENGGNHTFITDENGLKVEGLPWGDYYFSEVLAPDGYELSADPIPFSFDKTVQTASVTGRNFEKEASVVLTKKDAENGAVLKNAYYDLYRKETDSEGAESFKKVKENLRTNAAGEIVIEGLKFGTYKFTEVQPPKGYKLSSEEPEFTLNASTAETMVELSHTDERKLGSAKLLKTAEDGMPLSGAVYDLYKEGTEPPVCEGLTTGTDGFTPEIIDLDWGTYRFEEKKAPQGYTLHSTPVYFTVDADHADTCQTVTATDQRIPGSVKLIKKDETTKEKLLAGAEFNLYKNDGTLVREGLTTGADGTVEVNGIDWGSYYFEETKAPDGYGLAADKVRFSVNAENCTVLQELTCYDPVGTVQIKINKEINTSYEPFGTPTFLYRVSGTDISGFAHTWYRSITLSEETIGSVTLSEIPAGTYEITELSGSRYLQTEVTGEKNVTVENGKGIADLTVETEAEVSFKNEMEQYEKVSHMINATNLVASMTRLTGIRVTYTGPAVIESETESEYTFTKEDVSVTAYYDDGSEKEVPFKDLTLSPATVTGNYNTSGAGYTVEVTYEENGITMKGAFSVEIALQVPARPYTVTYDANGGYFGGSTDVSRNEVEYLWEEVTYSAGGVVKTAKTANVTDKDTYTAGYGAELADTQVVTIPGAPSLKVTVTYQTYNSSDWVAVYEGADITPTSSNYRSSTSGKLYGRTMKTKTYTIEGDTVQFFFASNGSSNGYFGYYAEVTNPEEFTVWENAVHTGSYREPEHLTKVFVGWYTDEACTEGKEFRLEEQLTEDVRVYAKWREPVSVFDTGENVNVKMKKLAGNSSASYRSTNTVITAIKMAEVSPDVVAMTSANLVSTANSEVPIYMWYEDGTIWWWSKDKTPALNADASDMFYYCKGLADLGGLANWDSTNVTNMGYMFDGCKGLTSLEPLKEWQFPNVTSMSYMFYGCSGLTSLTGAENWTFPNVTDMGHMFSDCSGLTSLEPLKDWTFPNVTNMSYMFSDCSGLTSLEPLKDWTFPNVTNMSYMFASCSGLTSLTGAENWTFPNVTDMRAMFYVCRGLTSLTGAEEWTFPNVTDMRAMFSDCSGLTSLTGAENWTFPNVTDMSQMFYKCDGLTSLTGAENWQFPNVTDMGSMFDGCKGLTSLEPLKEWQFPNVTDMGSMFYNCSGLTSLTGAENWQFPNVTDMGSMFYKCSGLTSLTGAENWQFPNVTDMGSMFYNCDGLTSLTGAENWQFPNVTDMGSMFYNCDGLTSLAGAEEWTFPNVTDMSSMFYGCGILSDIKALSKWNTSSVTNMSYMFSGKVDSWRKTYGCEDLLNLDALSNWDVSSVTNMVGMFAGCSGLTNIDGLSNWNTSSVTSMRGIFTRCSNLTNVNALSNWNTSSVTDMGGMFAECSNLTSIDGLSNWNTSSVTRNVSYVADSWNFGMFAGCSGLTNIDGLSNWDVSGIPNMVDMFAGCSGLTNIDGLSNWNTSSVTDMGTMFRGCSNLTNVNALSNWNTSNVADMGGMFYYCSSLTNIDGLSNWNTSSVTSVLGYYNSGSIGMFENCSSLTDASGINDWDISSVANFSKMFCNCPTHPEFTKITGTWSNGTFTPAA